MQTTTKIPSSLKKYMTQQFKPIHWKEINWQKQYPGIDFYDIQKMIIHENKEKTGVFLGTGVGKTLTCLILAEGKILVICPKQQMLDETWQKNSKKFKLDKDLTVINYDMFWRNWEEYSKYDTIILDECHRALGVYPETRQRNKKTIVKASKTFEAILNYIMLYPPKRFYLASATPVSKPMNLWAIAQLFGLRWDFYKFRQTFYFLTMMGRRQVWLPRKDAETLERLAGNVRKMGYTGGLADFADVPEQTHKVVPIELTDEQKRALKELMEDEADPLIRRSRMRTIENGILYGKKVEAMNEWEDRMVKETKVFKSGKIDYILERAIEFPKLFIFAAYTGQIMEISKALEKEGYKVFTVTAKTKNRATVFEEAESLKACIVVCQASICEGYRVPSCPCVIFASKSNRFLHYDQGKGRIMDAEHLKKNLYLHLTVEGGADEACHKSIMTGADFQEKLSPL